MAPSWHSNHPNPVGTRDLVQLSKAPHSSLTSTLQRSLRSFHFRGGKAASETEDLRGPLGLRLLHSPPDPLIDFVFVHGLRGGSVKTWQKEEDRRLYWPEAWLPREPDLQNARISTFGYNSDWGETKETTCLDICDFGRSLLSEMSTCPQLRKGNQTPIILIGHSMGGLVIKKAYLLARQDYRTKELADRIQCMFFLATPHRGSESAKLLNNVLRASGVLSPKQYISDIDLSSPVLAAIDDEFKDYLDRLRLWSFYETIKTNMGINTVMIVERDSAAIGHVNESRVPLNANHRNVCKFESPADPNYVSIRNSLVKATEDILGEKFKQREEEMRMQTRLLESYMHIDHNPEDDLATIESERSPGSCEWVTKLKSFELWRDTRDEAVLFYWLTGQAGAGKSVLATYIVRSLQGLGVDTCFYFFRQGQNFQQTVSGFLRSLAFQMAVLHPSVRQVLSSMGDAAVTFDRDDERAIWRRIFVNGILAIPIPTAQYWVVDGLDECIDSEKLFPLLQNVDSSFHIRILASSRPFPGLGKHLAPFASYAFRHHIEVGDTRSDIRGFVESNSESLPVEPKDRPALVERLVEKSDGAFLWAGLAVRALGDAFSEEDVDEVLREVPTGMVPLYSRILETMARNTRHTGLIRHILKWTVCSTRPLTTLELQAALTLDLRSKILNVGKVVEELCGQLLRVDKNGNILLVHATAREFLLRGPESVFGMDEGETNGHLATACLKYLAGDEMRPPRHPALVSREVQRSPLLEYACTSFSEHLGSAHSLTDEELPRLLDKFFSANVLSWVEYILSQKGNLYYLTRASRNLGQYLDRSEKSVSPPGDLQGSIESWQTDLVRVALKFGNNLLEDPASIYFLVPPLCPSETSIHKQFAKSSKGLCLSGLSNSAWDDCISHIDYRQSRARSLAACDGFFALGMQSGDIRMYKQATCEEFASLYHGEAVTLLRFDAASRKLASAGLRQLKMWSVDGTLLWSAQHGVRLAVMAFTGDNECLVTVDKHSNLATWDSARDGTETIAGEDQDRGRGSNMNPDLGASGLVLRADICPNGELLAVAYCGRPTQVWSIEHDALLTTCNTKRENPGVRGTPVAQLLFNPCPGTELLAVAYQDLTLAIFNPWDGGDGEVASVDGHALTLAATSDGRTLATGSTAGVVRLWDFGTLRLLQVVRSSECYARALAFSGDGRRLYDIRDMKTKVWELAALERGPVGRESVGTGITAAPGPGNDRAEEVVDMTCILAPPGTGVIIAGRDDGSVRSYDAISGKFTAELYSHRLRVLVRGLSWNGRMIASADLYSRVDVYAVLPAGAIGGKVLGAEFPGPVRDVLLHPTAPWLLVIEPRSATLVGVETDARYPLPVDEANDYRAWLWFSPCAGWTCLLGARAREVDVFYGLEQDDRRGSKPQAVWGLAMGDGNPVPSDVTHLSSDKRGRYLAVELHSACGDSEEPKLIIYGTAHLADRMNSEQGEPIVSKPTLAIAARHIKTFLGFYGDRAVFLDRRLWVRSVDLSKTAKSSDSADALAERHFYIPWELVGASNGVGAVVTDAGTVVFPKEGELGVVRNAFETSFKRPAADTTGNAPGASGRRRRGRGFR